MRRNCAIQLGSNKLLGCLSVSTICLLALASIIIISIISITPIIILGIGQTQTGQRDLILQPYSDYINNTKLQQAILPHVAMPRTQVLALVYPEKKQGVGYFFDFKLQADNHLGNTGGNLKEDNGNVIFIHEDFRLKEGDKKLIQLNFRQTFNAIKNYLSQTKSTQSNQISNQITYISELPIAGIFTVGGTFYNDQSKYGQQPNFQYIYFSINKALQFAVNQTYKRFQQNSSFPFKLQSSALIRYLNSNQFSLSQYSKQVTVNMPNRIEVYSNADYQVTFQTCTNFGRQIMQKISLFSLSADMPIADSLQQLSYFGMFIGVILKLIIVSLFALSVIMMNNTLMVGVQKKTFDFAVLKVMGSNRIFTITNILLDSMKYVVIGNIIAFPLAYFVLIQVSVIFKQFFGYQYKITPTLGSIIGGFLIGVCVPIVSAISPIKGVLNNDLVQSLNPIRNKTSSFHTQIYIQGRQFPYGKLFFGIIATTFGLMIYYLLPKGLINKDISLLLVIFFAILLGLLLGLIMFSFSFQYIIEKIVAYVTLFWTNKVDFTLMLKNLSGHRFKNRRASILYSLSVAFVVFVSVGIDIQMQTVFYQMLKRHSSYIQVSSKGSIIDKQYYDDVLKNIDGISGWSYRTQQLLQFSRKYGVQKIMVSDKARLFFQSNNIFGVSPNFLKGLYSEYYSASASPLNSTISPFEYLYTIEGSNTAIISSYTQKKFRLNNDDKHRQFLMNFYFKNKMKRVNLNFSSSLDKKTGFAFSRFQFGRHSVVVSASLFKQLANVGSYQEIPYNTIQIQLKNPREAKDISRKIREKINGFDKVWDYDQLRQTIDNISDVLSKILLILLVVVLIISFFSLVTTSYINIINQTNQIGVLLTLGYQKSRIVKIYIYQAFVLVMNSCLIGIVVGSFVAYMMSLQRQLFGDYPIMININGIWIIIGSAIISSILSTIQPARQILSKPISSIMKYV